MRRLLIAIGVLAAAALFAGSSIFTITPTEVGVIIPSAAAALGPTAPSIDENDHCSGRGFDNVNESVNISFEVPNCWDASSNLMLKVYWCPTAGDAPGDTEDVQFDATWRSIDWEAEDADQGTEASGTVTYTQSGAGDDKDTFESEITIAHTGGNQPISIGDVLSFHFNRDVTNESNSYSGKAIVNHWEIEYYQDRLFCDHHN